MRELMSERSNTLLALIAGGAQRSEQVAQCLAARNPVVICADVEQVLAQKTRAFIRKRIFAMHALGSRRAEGVFMACGARRG